jgi:hypothetical protein
MAFTTGCQRRHGMSWALPSGPNLDPRKSAKSHGGTAAAPGEAKLVPLLSPSGEPFANRLYNPQLPHAVPHVLRNRAAGQPVLPGVRKCDLHAHGRRDDLLSGASGISAHATADLV